MATPIDPDSAYSILSAARRRTLLALFLDVPLWNVGDLAETIAKRECERTDGPVDRDLVDAVHVELVHNHLPRLVDHGVLEWDGRSGDVVRSERFDALEPYLSATTGSDDRTVATPPSEHR